MEEEPAPKNPNESHVDAVETVELNPNDDDAAVDNPSDGSTSSSKIRLVVDVRERALIEALTGPAAAAGIPVEVRQLDVADVEVRTGSRLLLLVERKTLPDLASSLRDGRYHEQKRRLESAAGCHQAASDPPCCVCYVIEGGASGRFAFDGMLPSQWPVESRLQALLASLMVRHRTPAAFTRDVLDTAAFLLLSARLLGEQKKETSYAAVACKQSAAASRKRDNVDPRQCFLHQLCQVPGVSAGIAAKIGEHYASMGHLVRALSALPDERQRLLELKKVPLVGPKLSEQICRFVGV
jgi:ERCC4-type nuclease